jgi:hypothetical protein
MLPTSSIHLGQHFWRLSKPQNKEKKRWTCKGTRSIPKGHRKIFGVLHARFAIVRGAANFLDKKTLNNIMICCAIFHNMIVENEKWLNLEFFYANANNRAKPQRNPDRIQVFLDMYR